MRPSDNVSKDETLRIPYPLPDSPNGYWRSWCKVCGEPVRVSKDNVDRAVCDDCCQEKTIKPHKHGLTPRQATALNKMQFGAEPRLELD